MLTHGLSGSGKTLLTQGLLELIGAIRVRADVERKRLFGLDPLARSDAALKATLYSATATQVTQARLREMAALALPAGHSVILDATFLAARNASSHVRWPRPGRRFVHASTSRPASTLCASGCGGAHCKLTMPRRPICRCCNSNCCWRSRWTTTNGPRLSRSTPRWPSTKPP